MAKEPEGLGQAIPAAVAAAFYSIMKVHPGKEIQDDKRCGLGERNQYLSDKSE